MKKLNNIQLLELSNFLNKMEQLPNFDINQDVIIYYDENNNFLALEGLKQSWGWALTDTDVSKINPNNSMTINYSMVRLFMALDTPNN